MMMMMRVVVLIKREISGGMECAGGKTTIKKYCIWNGKALVVLFLLPLSFPGPIDVDIVVLLILLIILSILIIIIINETQAGWQWLDAIAERYTKPGILELSTRIQIIPDEEGLRRGIIRKPFVMLMFTIYPRSKHAGMSHEWNLNGLSSRYSRHHSIHTTRFNAILLRNCEVVAN